MPAQAMKRGARQTPAYSLYKTEWRFVSRSPTSGGNGDQHKAAYQAKVFKEGVGLNQALPAGGGPKIIGHQHGYGREERQGASA
jgi:hypothetical protein